MVMEVTSWNRSDPWAIKFYIRLLECGRNHKHVNFMIYWDCLPYGRAMGTILHSYVIISFIVDLFTIASYTLWQVTSSV